MKEKKAVALKYPKGVEAPFIVAKGKGYKAEKIIEEAEINRIPIVDNEPVVDLLGIQNIGDFVPQQAWEIVAQIFSVIIKEKE